MKKHTHLLSRLHHQFLTFLSSSFKYLSPEKILNQRLLLSRTWSLRFLKWRASASWKWFIRQGMEFTPCSFWLSLNSICFSSSTRLVTGITQENSCSIRDWLRVSRDFILYFDRTSQMNWNDRRFSQSEKTYYEPEAWFQGNLFCK